MKALFIIPWRPHDILVAVVLSRQYHMKETIYILSKYTPPRINIYRGFGKNWFHINTNYLNEKLDITVTDKGSQKHIRAVALFARTEKYRCWESAWKPDSQGLGFNWCWPWWGCRCGISKGGRTPGRQGGMAALLEGGQCWGFFFLQLLVQRSCLIPWFERNEDILYVYTWNPAAQDYWPGWQGAAAARRDGQLFCHRQFWSSTKVIFIRREEKNDRYYLLCSLLSLRPALWGFCTFLGGGGELGPVPATGRALLYGIQGWAISVISHT